MNFMEIAENRQSCRSYDPCRVVEKEKIDAILNAARLSPSACTASLTTSQCAKANVQKRWQRPLRVWV